MTVRIYIILFLISSLLIPAEAFCGGDGNKKKKVENPTFLQKVYHDMTTRFNYFFNARLKLNESLRQLQDGHQDNYNEILPVRQYGNKEKRSSTASQMDEVIKKSGIAIQLHKISKWVDDCYLLIAKANFLKGENDSSIDALEYIESEFSNRIRNTDLITTEYDKQLEEREKNQPREVGEKRKRTKNPPPKKDNSEVERLNKEKKRDKEKAQKERKEEAKKENKERIKDRELTRKEAAKERDKAQKEKEKAKKEREKERKEEAKERVKEQEKKSAKDYNKEKAKASKDRKKSSAKDYNKAKKEAAKQRAKEAANRKKGNKKVDEVFEALENREKEISKEEKEKQRLAEEQAKEAERAAKEEQARLEEEAKAEKERLEDEAKEEQARLEEEEKLAKEEAKAEKERLEEEEKLAKEEAKAAKKNAKEDAEEAKSDFRGSGSQSAFGHKKVNHESLLWKAENYIDMENYQSAKQILDQIGNNNSFPKNLRSDYYALKAIYFIENEMWEESIDALQNAIDNTRKRPTKARYHFILAQISQRQALYARANESFKQVLKNKPGYDMEFNTRLQMAQTMMLSDPSSKAKVVKSLKKMLKDEKNVDYLDKIHYTLAEVELADGNVDLAIEQLKESAAASTKDQNQKGLSFLKLAEIYFESQDYRNSGAYYDSAMVSISKDHPEYEDLMKRKEVMVELASHLNTIHLEDSLQTLANMEPKERNMALDKIIGEITDKVNKELEAKENEEGVADFSDLDKLSGINQPGAKPKPNPSVGSMNPGSFYFYNSISRDRGYNNFKNQWGNRSSTDWWAIASKSQSGEDNFADGGASSLNVTPGINVAENEEEAQNLALKGSLNRDFFVAQLPLDESSLKASNDRIIESMYQSGRIYKESLDKNDEAIAMLNDLLKRYANNPYDLDANYQLYQLYKDKKNMPLSNQHKNYILQNYPDSDYAQYIENPDYAATVAKLDGEINEFYEQSYALFANKQYDEVLARHEQADEMFEVNPIQSKFEFLSAQAIGYTKDAVAYEEALSKIVNNYPGTDVGIRSKEILEFFRKGIPKNIEEDEIIEDTDDSVYKANLNSKHFFIIHFNFTNANINKVMNQVSDFNTSMFSLEKFKVSDRLLRKTTHLILVEDFTNAEEALKYYKQFENELNAQFSELGGSEFTYFVMSKKNYTQFFKYKIVEDYLSFFAKAYLNQ